MGVPAQPDEIVHGLAIVLLAADQCLHGGVEGLNPNFELQRSGRETYKPGFERFRQMVGNQFEVQEQAFIQPLQEKIQNPRAGLDVQVESAIHEFEMAHAALMQHLQFGQERLQRKGPSGLIQRRQAELAFERTAARSFDVNQTVGDVLVGIEPIRREQAIQWWMIGDNDLFVRRVPLVDSLAQLRERQVAWAGDQIVGQLDDCLPVPFMTHLGTAEYHDQIRPYLLEQGDDLSGFHHVPDIDAKTDDARLFGQQCLGDVQRSLGDDEFADGGVSLQLA